ncbi:MAG TPA: hypothetical protein VEB86_00105 [Chryseosolibacter sp.]|nr:hypothetical protein [Chryseosolibacter sp.]
MRHEVPLKGGKRDGLFIQYFETGEVESKTYYAKGKRNGRSVIYYKNGKIRQDRVYKDGTCLTAKDFTEEGFLRQVTTYDSAGRIFDYFSYNPDGTRDFAPLTKKAIFIVSRDTIALGEKYLAYIRLGNRQFDKVDVVLGDISDSQIVQKNPRLPKVDSLTAMVSFVPDSIGRNQITGVIFESSHSENSPDSMDVIPFKHYYYVEAPVSARKQ